MGFFSSKLYSVITLTCPHCHEGPFFVSHPYDLSKAGDLLKACPECHRSYEMEPGFYYGAMYVAYGLGVAICLAAFLLLHFFAPMMPLYWIIVIMSGIMLVGGPYFYALSKIIWANTFIGYTPTQVGK